MPRHPKVQSAVTNAKRRFLAIVDGRSVEARRFQDILSEVEAEHGGVETMTAAQKAAARAFAQLCVEREKMEWASAAGQPFDAEAYGVLCDRMDRQARRLGPAPKKRKTLDEHLAALRDA